MRSNVPLHARKKLPAGRAKFMRWYGVTTTRSARADVPPEAARRLGPAPGTRGSQEEGNKTNSRGRPTLHAVAEVQQHILT